MRRILKTMSCLVMTVLLVVGCNIEEMTSEEWGKAYPEEIASVKTKSSTPVLPDSELDIPTEYNKVGQLHNMAVHFMYNKIRTYYIKNPEAKKLTDEESRILMQEAMIEFGKRTKSINLYYEYFEQGLELFWEKKPVEIENPKLKEVLESIKVAIPDKYEDNYLPKLKEQLESVTSKAKDNLSKEEMTVVYCAASIGYNSYFYWTNNYKKWIFALNYPTIATLYKKIAEEKGIDVKSCPPDYEYIPTFWEQMESWWDLATDPETWDEFGDMCAESFGEAWEEVSSGVSNWWNNGGSSIVYSDITGGIEGAAAVMESGSIPLMVAYGIGIGASASIMDGMF